VRVLLVSHEWEAEHPGGAQRSASALAHGLAASGGMEVTLASAVERLPPHARDGRLGERDGVTELLVESRTDAAFFTWTDPVQAGNWERIIRDVRPDVVHMHHYFHIGVDLPLLARRLVPRAGLVLTLHEYMAICLRSGQMVDGHGNLCMSSAPRRCAECVAWSIDTVAARGDYLRRGLGAVDVLVTPSEFARARYLDWAASGRQQDIRVIPNALAFDERSGPLDPTEGARGLRLAFIGQHTPNKGLDILLEAVERVRSVAPTALDRVDVYGSGSERFSPEFHAGLTAALRAGLPLVRGHGRYAQSELPAILDGIDAIVVPSTWWENSPVVIEEALSRRVPVICSDIGGMAEKVRDGLDGWHFQAGNAASLADVISRLAKAWPQALPAMRRPTPIVDVVAQHLDAYQAAAAAALAHADGGPGVR
jgi:glycosyltransferase involved in cell wall biosynthesis